MSKTLTKQGCDRVIANVLVGGKSLLEWSQLFESFLIAINEEFDSGHRLDHVRRVTHSAINLAIQEKAKLEVVIPAIWLHDCVPVSKFSQDRAKSSVMSSEFALKLLSENSYPHEYYSEIKHAIESHSFSANIIPNTLEAKVVQDADRLDSLGAIGIARTMMVGGKGGRPLYDEHEAFPITREMNDRKFTLDHFFIKLLKLKDTLWTDSAKQEGSMRTKFMVEYLKQLSVEIGEPFHSII